MKLESEECKKALKEYKTTNEVEKLAVKILLTDACEVVNIPGMTDLTGEQIDELASVIGDIRDNLGIE